MSQSIEVLVTVLPDQGEDDRRLEEHRLDLESELRNADIDAIEPVAVRGQAGGKSAELAELGSVLVQLAPIALGGVIATTRAWLKQRRTGKVCLELDGDVLVLEGATVEMQDDVIHAYLERHRPPR
jgi:hypothetical protein